MPLADLPTSPGPYLALMAAGFAIGAFGHLVRSRWLIGVGIATIVAAIVLFQLLNNQHSEPGGLPGSSGGGG